MRRDERRGPIPIRCVHLGTAGEPEGARVCAEYTGLLVDPAHEEEALADFGAAVLRSGADELVADGLTLEAFDRLRRALPEWRVDVRYSEDPWIDLARLRREGADYRRSALSKNSRGQVSRTLNAYAKRGEIETEIATSAGRGVEMLHELATLHQATWHARGRPGAFASERFRRFHETLVTRRLEAGGVHLVRVTVGGAPIGLLYSFVDRSRIFFYQSGFRYEEDNRLRPGLATHVCAVERCLELGLDEYHFLAGDETTPRYKSSLSTDTTRLAWAVFQRPGAKTRLVETLRSLKQGLERLRGRPATGG